MKSREQIAIEALTEVADNLELYAESYERMARQNKDDPRVNMTCVEVDIRQNMKGYVLSKIAALSATPPAQGSIDADASVGDDEKFWYELSMVRLEKGEHLQNKRATAFLVPFIDSYIADRATRQSAAPNRVPVPQNADQAVGMVLLATRWLEENAPDRLKAAPSEPVPQGVPEGWPAPVTSIAIDGKRYTAPTATSGGEAVDENGNRAVTFATGKIAKWSGEPEVLKLIDDGYRIRFSWVSGGPVDSAAYDGELWAEYKHCDLPGPSFDIANYLMEPRFAPPPLPAATDAASVPSCPEIQKAFMTLESNGEARTIVLKFNQSADAYAVHDFLLKGASAIGLMYPGDAAGVRASTLEEAATELEAMQKSAADDIAYWGNSMDGNDLAAQSALTCGASAIRALISKETGNAN